MINTCIVVLHTQETIMFILVDYIIDALHRSSRYYRAMSELNNLTDRELRDLGINRYEIEQLARASAMGKIN